MNEEELKKEIDKSLGRPTIDDIQLTISIVHKKQMAPKDSTFFILKCKHGTITYSKVYPIKRTDMPAEVEESIKVKLKDVFLQLVLNDMNKKVPLQKPKRK